MSHTQIAEQMTDLGGALLRSASFRRRDIDVPLCAVKDFVSTPPLTLSGNNPELAKFYKRAASSYYAEEVSKRDHLLFWESMIRLAPYRSYTFEGLDNLVSRSYPGLPTYTTLCVEPISVLYQVLFLMTLDPCVEVVIARGDKVKLAVKSPVKTGFVEATGGRFAVEVQTGRGRFTRYQRATILWQGQGIDNWWHLPTKAMAVRLGVRAASAGRFFAGGMPGSRLDFEACLALAQQSQSLGRLLPRVNWVEHPERELVDLDDIRGRLIPLLSSRSHLSIRQQLYTLTVPHMVSHAKFVSVFGDPLDRFTSHLTIKYVEDKIFHLSGFIN